jgi:prepilin-type N-terminal cleavage/methylation domain-containing protein
MKQGGFSLIELLVVVGIISILVVVLGFEFTGWQARYNVETQIKTMHIDLMTARQKAMQKNTQYVAVLLSADPACSDNKSSYLICEDGNSNGVCGDSQDTTMPSLSKNCLRYQMNSDLGGAPIIMNQRGLLMTAQNGANTNIFLNNIWLTNPDTGAVYNSSEVDYDCISLSATRIGVGKYDGATCAVK